MRALRLRAHREACGMIEPATPGTFALTGSFAPVRRAAEGRGLVLGLPGEPDDPRLESGRRSMAWSRRADVICRLSVGIRTVDVLGGEQRPDLLYRVCPEIRTAFSTRDYPSLLGELCDFSY